MIGRTVSHYKFLPHGLDAEQLERERFLRAARAAVEAARWLRPYLE